MVSGRLNKLGFGEASFNRVFSRYKQSAKERNISFEINKEDFLEFTQQKCYYCGKEPETLSKNKCNNGDFVYNGLDRVDSSLGYTKENVVTCCKQCNFSKGKTHQNEFVEWIKSVYLNLFSDNSKI